MPAGFQNFLPDSSIVQIDDSYANLVLVQSGMVSRTSRTYGSGPPAQVTLQRHFVEAPGDALVAIGLPVSSPPSGLVVCLDKVVTLANGRKEWRLWVISLSSPIGSGSDFYIYANANTYSGSLPYYIFRPARALSALPDLGYGLEVFDEQGRPVYSSALYPATPVDFVGPVRISKSESSPTLRMVPNSAIQSGRSYAVMPAEVAFYDSEVDDYGYSCYGGFGFMPGGHTFFTVGFGGPFYWWIGAGFWDFGDASALFLDVTNFPTNFNL